MNPCHVNSCPERLRIWAVRIEVRRIWAVRIEVGLRDSSGADQRPKRHYDTHTVSWQDVGLRASTEFNE